MGSQLKEPISLAILSRDEILIRYILESQFHNIEIAAHPEDLQQYVSSELNKRISSRELRFCDLSLKDEILTRLVKEAQGMWVLSEARV
ncbi:ankyrin repeat protein [Colletotrichum sojae]|uniref:Ankyrin repeat protein n=1 Tax=Colletotrichum sojae TaxID=2175907 RepID=A0A8H6ILU7_9PEZI|nr:ankyrin repeat protein [Colletotrichum sojae]